MSLEPGQVLAHYRITAKIGEGGMGEVYEAQDTELDRRVALKVLPSGVSRDPDRLERFRREARTIAALNHPNIITIHGIEEDGDQRFLVMERVEGRSLDRIVPAEGMTLQQIFDIAIPMSEALAAAHAKRVIHRDLKPANVMVTPEGHVKVLDFGLAKVAEEADSQGDVATQLETRRTPLTGEGVVMGTAPYMSPEQLQGKPLDHRTDLFSFGVVLYEMVRGQRPFQGDSTIALASSILKDTPASVSEARADLPRHLGRIIQQCLEKDPDQRFQTARDVRNQLAALRREAVSEQAQSMTLPAAVPARPSRKMIWAAAAVVVLAMIVAGGFALRRSSSSSVAGSAPGPAVQEPEREQKMIVVLPFENLGEPDDEYFADGMTEEITSRLASLDGLGVISRTSAMQYRTARPSVREIGEELGVDYILEGTVRWQRSADGSSRVRVTPQLINVADDTHLWAERYDRVLEDIFEVQSDIARQVSEQLGLALGDPGSQPTENLAAYDAFLRGNDYLNRGQELFSAEPVRFAVQMYEEAIRLDPGFALAHARLAVAHEFMYDTHHDRTQERITAARDAAEKALELEPDLAVGHYARGVIYANDPAKQDYALEELELALKKQPNDAEIWEEIGMIQTDQGRWEEGVANLERAMELNPKLGRLPCQVGGSYFAMRNFEKAVLYHDHAIRLTPDRSCPYVCQLWIRLNRDGATADARSFLGEIPESIGLEENPPILYPWVMMEMIDGNYETALETLFSEPAEVLTFQDFYLPKDLLAAQLYGMLDRRAEANARYESAKTHLEARVRELPDDGRIHSSLGIAYAGLGRREEAIDEARIGTELEIGGWGDQGGHRHRDLAQVYMMVGDLDAAIDELDLLLSTPSFFAAPFLHADPTWQPLRDHPRFRELMARYLPGSM